MREKDRERKRERVCHTGRGFWQRHSARKNLDNENNIANCTETFGLRVAKRKMKIMVNLPKASEENVSWKSVCRKKFKVFSEKHLIRQL